MPIIDLAAVVPVVPIESREAGARRAAPPCRSSTAGKVVPIIQGHGLASWCRAGSPSCRRVDRRRPVSGKVAMGSGFIFPEFRRGGKGGFPICPRPEKPAKELLALPLSPVNSYLVPNRVFASICSDTSFCLLEQG